VTVDGAIGVVLPFHPADAVHLGREDLSNDLEPAGDRGREHPLAGALRDLGQAHLNLFGQTDGVERVLGHDARTGYLCHSGSPFVSATPSLPPGGGDGAEDRPQVLRTTGQPLAAAGLVRRFEEQFPAATSCFAEDLDGLLAHLRLPARHRIHRRTTNLIERSFEEERRRTKVIPRFADERSAMKLVFAVLIRCIERWSRVSITDIERHQLRLLRAELGIDPPPTPEEKEEPSRRRKIA
jgi:hypothetical protein